MKKNVLIILTFLFLGVFTRVIPHPPNFTAIGAIALFGGAFIQNKHFAFLTPITIMLISDLILGYQINIAVYLSFIIIVGLGMFLKTNQTLYRIIPITIVASFVFFIITNFSVFLTSSIYTKDIFGLLECYTLALPFFGNTIVGNMTYTIIMFFAFNKIQNKAILISR